MNRVSDNCQELLLRLQSAYENGTIERFMKQYANYELLIIALMNWLSSDSTARGRYIIILNQCTV